MTAGEGLSQNDKEQKVHGQNDNWELLSTLHQIHLAQVRNAQGAELITFDVRFDQDMIDTKP